MNFKKETTLDFIQDENVLNITDLIKEMFMSTFKVSEAEYDCICENASDDELNILVQKKDAVIDFATKRKMISIIKKYKAINADNSSRFDF